MIIKYFKSNLVLFNVTISCLKWLRNNFIHEIVMVKNVNMLTYSDYLLFKNSFYPWNNCYKDGRPIVFEWRNIHSDDTRCHLDHCILRVEHYGFCSNAPLDRYSKSSIRIWLWVHFKYSAIAM